MLKGLSYIGFGRGAATGNKFSVASRLTGGALPGEFHTATLAEVEAAANLAEKAFPTYSGLSRNRRAEFLRAIATQLEARKDAIIERANHETALPEARLTGELGRTCGQLRFFAGILEDGKYLDVRIDLPEPDRQPLPKPDIRSMKQPIGPVVVFGASNFPLAFSVAGGDTTSALAAGCPVIVKAHPAHPGTSELAAEAIIAAAQATDMPEGVFSMLFDCGTEVGQALVADKAVCGVGFTGSRAGGLAIQAVAQARKNPIPVFAEMSSINPVVVLPGKLAAEPEAFAAGLHASATLGVGQFCTNPGVVFLVGTEGRDVFMEAFTKLMSESTCGVMLSEGIGQNYVNSAAKLAAITGVSTHASVASAGQPAVYEVSVETFISKPDVQNEVFGPTTLLVICDNIEEAVSALRTLEGQLTGSVHGTSEEIVNASHLFAALQTKVGRIIINQFPTGVEVCHAMVHGGPFPATTDGQSTSVGGRAIDRWLRPVCYQNFPTELLPEELR